MKKNTYFSAEPFRKDRHLAERAAFGAHRGPSGLRPSGLHQRGAQGVVAWEAKRKSFFFWVKLGLVDFLNEIVGILILIIVNERILVVLFAVF